MRVVYILVTLLWSQLDVYYIYVTVVFYYILYLPPCLPACLFSLLKDAFQTFLYNDELHSFDEVIHILTHNVGLTHTEAVSLATFIDRKVEKDCNCIC